MKTRRPVLGTFVTLIVTITLLPIPVLVWMSLFNQNYLVIPPKNGYTLQWFLDLPKASQLFPALEYSLILAVSAALVSTTIGIAAAFGIRQGLIKRAAWIESLMTMPLTVPAIVTSMALYIFLFNIGNALGFRILGSFETLLGAHVLITLPWAFRVGSAGVLGIDRGLERASRDLGRGPVGTFFKVTLPLLKSTIASCATLVFIFSFADLEMSLFLVAPGKTTLPVAMQQYAEFKLDPTLAAMAVVQLAIIVVLLIVADKLFGFGRTFAGGTKQ